MPDEVGDKTGMSGGRRKSTTTRRKKKEQQPLFKFVGLEEPDPIQHTVIRSDQLLHNGLLYHLGDVVRVISESDQTYFGVILRFWTDQYAEKYVTLQWLLPTEDISRDGTHFVGRKYTQGPVHPDLLDIRSIGYVMDAKDLGAADNSPVFNSFGELAVLFNSNMPKNTALSSNLNF